MNGLDELLSGEKLPNFGTPSSGNETTIFTPSRTKNSCTFYKELEELMDPPPKKVTREYVDISNYKSASCFSVRSREYCANLYESFKMKKIPNYENTVHLSDQKILAKKIDGRHSHDSCISAQRPLKRYCKKEMCPMVIFKDMIFEELFEGPPRLSFERFEKSPRYSAIESTKFLITTKIRNAVSRIELLFGSKETRAEKHYREVQKGLDNYHKLLFSDFSMPPIEPLLVKDIMGDDYYPVENFKEVLDAYHQRLTEIRSCIPGNY